jgi:hypothetical protein
MTDSGLRPVTTHRGPPPAEPPEIALAGLAATWQAILRNRHPEFRGLVVEVDGRTNSPRERAQTPGSARDADVADAPAAARRAA